MDLGIPELPEERLGSGGAHRTREYRRQMEKIGFYALEAETGQAPDQPLLGGGRAAAEESLYQALTA